MDGVRWHLEAKDATHILEPIEPSLPKHRINPAPNLNSAEVEKPDLGVLTLRLTLFLGVARAGFSPACSSSCLC